MTRIERTYETAEESDVAAILRSLFTRVSSSRVSFADVVTKDLLRDGERLVSVTGEGPIEVSAQAQDEVILNDEWFASSSAAATALCDGEAANGGGIWNVMRDGQTVPLAVFRSEIDAW